MSKRKATSAIEECRKKGRVGRKQGPWINKLEFETVHTSLYSKNPIDQRWAVDRISEWSAKNPAIVPLSVVATEGLVRAIIQDYIVTNNISVSGIPDVALTYCSALIRFVNLTTERGQQSEFKCSVRQAAEKLGIPDWIVELRHQAAHASIPSLDKLRSAAKVCLNWLEENYWKPALVKKIDVCLVNNDADDEKKCRELLSDFQRMQYQHLFGSKESYRNKEAGLAVKQVVTGIASLIKTNGKIFISTLAKPKFLLSLTACSNPLIDSSDCFIEERAVSLPSTMEKFWRPVISAIHAQRLLKEFVLTLLKLQNKLGDERQRLAIAWIWRILDATTESWGIQQRSFDVLKELRRHPPIFNWFELLDVCLHNTSKYTPAILPILVEHIYPPIPQRKKDSLMGLVAIYTGALVGVTSTDNVLTNNRVYTVENVKTVLELQDVVNRGETSLIHKENKWKLCDEDINWEDIPSGTFPHKNAVMGPKYLELREFSQEEVERQAAEEQVVAPVDVNAPLDESEELSADNKKIEEDIKMEENGLHIHKCHDVFGVADISVM